MLSPTFSFRLSLGLLVLLFMASLGCSSQKASRQSPELPARHWLKEVPGVPVESKGKLENAVQNLYDPHKKFTFEDAVYLTIQ
ncbi:MAG: hypothetical protein IJS50_04430, partial [Desulfovibrio sp.]|nr:hypothetical protein [Desulfovibrio sp.]